MLQLNTIQSKMSLNHQLLGNTQVVTLIRFKSPLNISLIESRLTSFRESNSIFNSSILKKNGAFYFIPTCKELPLFIEGGHIPEKLEVARREMNEIIDSESILWRLRIYCGKNEYFAVYTRHHAISDNFTSSLFIGSIFNDYSTKMESVPPVAGRIDSTRTEVHASYGTPLIEARNGHIHYTEHTALTKRETGIAYNLFSPKLTDRLAKEAKNKGVSLNSLLVHYYADTIMQYFRLPNILLNNAISIRSADDIQPGCFIDIASILLTSGCSNILTSHYNEAILTAKNTSLSSSIPTRMDISQSSFSISKFQENITETPLSIALTNNGQFKISNPDIIEIFNVVNRVGSNFPLSLHVSFFSQQLQLIFTFPQPFVDRETIESINKLLVTRLEAI